MIKYHKIKTVFERNPYTHKLKEGKFSLPEFEYLQHNDWVWTEKVDGTNIRIMYDGHLTFGGKTDNAHIPALLGNRLNELFLDKVDKLAKLSELDVCLYGEGYGARIQKGGGNYSPSPEFVLFDVKIDDWWLQREDVADIAHELALDVVPVVGTGTLHEMVEKAKTGFASCWGNFQAEGIVARPSTELKAHSGKRIITKVKFKDF